LVQIIDQLSMKHQIILNLTTGHICLLTVAIAAILTNNQKNMRSLSKQRSIMLISINFKSYSNSLKAKPTVFFS